VLVDVGDRRRALVVVVIVVVVVVAARRDASSENAGHQDAKYKSQERFLQVHGCGL
jgi:hypothetical protein